MTDRSAIQELEERLSAITNFTLENSADVPESLRGDRDWWQQNASFWYGVAQIKIDDIAVLEQQVKNLKGMQNHLREALVQEKGRIDMTDEQRIEELEGLLGHLRATLDPSGDGAYWLHEIDKVLERRVSRITPPVGRASLVFYDSRPPFDRGLIVALGDA